MKRRHLLAGAATLALARPVLALPQPDAILRFVPETDLPTLDPMANAGRVTRDHALMVYDMLFGIDRDGVAQPQMVSNYTVERGGLLWRLRLRSGQYFHDFVRVRASDCVASIRRWAARDPYGQALMAVTEELSAPDDLTVQFRLRTPFPRLAEALGKSTGAICAIMPARLAAVPPGQEPAEIIGSGPFTYVAAEREVGKRVVYARSETYVPTRAVTDHSAGAKDVNIGRVEWLIMDNSAADAALREGAVDWWAMPLPAMVPELAERRDVRLKVLGERGMVVTLRPNHLYPPFDKPAVRQALLAAISQEAAMRALAGRGGPRWRTGIGAFCSTAAPRDDTVPKVPDLAAAKAAIAAAGYAGETVRLLSPSGVLRPLTEALAKALDDLGMIVTVEPVDLSALPARLTSTAPVAEGGWSLCPALWEGEDMLDPIGHPLLRGTGRTAAPGWPTSSRLEVVRDAWIGAPDDAWRSRFLGEIERLMPIEVPYIPLGQIFLPTAYRTDLLDVQPGTPVFWSVRRKEGR